MRRAQSEPQVAQQELRTRGFDFPSSDTNSGKHVLQDRPMQRMQLEQQNKRLLLMSGREQSTMTVGNAHGPPAPITNQALNWVLLTPDSIRQGDLGRSQLPIEKPKMPARKQPRKVSFDKSKLANDVWMGWSNAANSNAARILWS